MTAANFATGLNYVWLPQNDSPTQGYHVTPGDAGLGTFGGVIEATWRGAVANKLVSGTLKTATIKQLSDVLKFEFWEPACDSLPPGLDLCLFNGRMMSGGYEKLFQEALGFTGSDNVDGWIGPMTVKTASDRDAVTLIHALHGAHYAYLTRLDGWAQFGLGWSRRLDGACAAALALNQQDGKIA